MANPRVANGHRRRELRKRVIGHYTVCAWEHCEWPGEPVDKTLHHLDPKAPTVDEIIPVSHGGDPLAWSNVRLMHRICNIRRGNGTRSTTRRPAPPAAFPTSTTW